MKNLVLTLISRILARTLLFPAYLIIIFPFIVLALVVSRVVALDPNNIFYPIAWLGGKQDVASIDTNSLVRVFLIFMGVTNLVFEVFQKFKDKKEDYKKFEFRLLAKLLVIGWTLLAIGTAFMGNGIGSSVLVGGGFIIIGFAFLFVERFMIFAASRAYSYWTNPSLRVAKKRVEVSRNLAKKKP